MIAKHVMALLAAVEKDKSIDTRSKAYSALRTLGLDDFGNTLWHAPLAKFPRLSALLPPMTPAEITQRWTGASGQTLLIQSVSFVRACSENYATITGKTLHDKEILDFGCGYGRFLRLFSYYTSNIRGVDAWDRSLAHCRNAGLGDIVALSDEIPTTLPYPGSFDFAFAFSIFTHLSEQSALAALSALRASAKPGSVLCITFRPIEFWNFAKTASLSTRQAEAETCRSAHETAGFAFLPHRSGNPAEIVHYGDTSFELEWLAPRAGGWRIARIDRSLNDSLQRYAFLVAE